MRRPRLALSLFNPRRRLRDRLLATMLVAALVPAAAFFVLTAVSLHGITQTTVNGADASLIQHQEQGFQKDLDATANGAIEAHLQALRVTVAGLADQLSAQSGSASTSPSPSATPSPATSANPSPSATAPSPSAPAATGAATEAPGAEQIQPLGDGVDAIIFPDSSATAELLVGALLAALLGRIPLDAGAATLGPLVVVGEVDQARGRFLGGETLLDAFGAAVPALAPAEVRTLLAKFGLRAAHVLRPAGTLSPGERTRAALALLQATGVNLLVLDEPTNHLDLPAIEQLESALAGFPGTLLLVTHDRRMLTAVSTNRHIEVDAGRVTSR